MPLSVAFAVNFITIVMGLVLAGFLIFFTLTSVNENEPRAARRAILPGLLFPLPFLLDGLAGLFLQQRPGSLTVLAFFLLLLIAGMGVALLLPFGNRIVVGNGKTQSRNDERDIMFSRRLLVAGSEKYEDYYRANPDKNVLDDKFRKRPGLMQPGALYCDPLTVAAAEASFRTVAAFHPILDEETMAEEPIATNPAKMSHFLKPWSTKLGAASAGITELQVYHLYSYIGRGEHYSQPVEFKHQFAVALTVEMDRYLLARAPGSPTIMESAQRYLTSGAIAVQLAEFIRNLGYSVRAHLDGSYRVVCPLVAREAGLGEIGRMGLLMRPKFGPRVRFALVTTNIPLVGDGRSRDLTLIDFCRHCRKCADVCPSKAISFDDHQETTGAE